MSQISHFFVTGRPIIGLENKRKAIVSINDDVVHWRMYLSLTEILVHVRLFEYQRHTYNTFSMSFSGINIGFDARLNALS